MYSPLLAPGQSRLVTVDELGFTAWDINQYK